MLCYLGIVQHVVVVIDLLPATIISDDADWKGNDIPN